MSKSLFSCPRYNFGGKSKYGPIVHGRVNDPLLQFTDWRGRRVFMREVEGSVLRNIRGPCGRDVYEHLTKLK